MHGVADVLPATSAWRAANVRRALADRSQAASSTHQLCRRGGLGRARRTVLPVRAIGAPPDAGPPPPPPPPPRPPRRTRLAASVISAPRQLDDYFEGSLYRRALWTCIAFAAGFYCADTVSLSFGALSVNDVVAAAVTVAFCEVVSYVYYQAPRTTLLLVFMNSFKIGVIAALIADALKLQG